MSALARNEIATRRDAPGSQSSRRSERRSNQLEDQENNERHAEGQAARRRSHTNRVSQFSTCKAGNAQRSRADSPVKIGI
jgi:hypothetical protein